MQETTWIAVDNYFCERLIPADPVLTATLQNSDAGDLPQHNVAPNQGKFLHLLASLQGAKTVLEFGTLGGYSTIWLARALPEGGRVVSLEFNPHNAAIAQKNIDRAGLSHMVDIRVGKALDTLPQLQAESIHPFDLIFIDADKPNNPHYLEWSLKLSRPGTLIIGDNVVRNGAVVDPASTDANVQGVRSFMDLMANNPRLSATALQTVGSKGYDGFSMALVIA
ncbi:O-methyltransferase [Undibacterium pigrum]|uniref:Putative O-methyltransferase YrrM n=1 Tax=Undibacterium pigrum TaxID=401470 RepID=A0A318IYT6_9BURK|nr:O-methyltransferase [Undibacterium pigrum]PXX41436.1 putative O-methyltransferase YrrM [Undibacterium pigrum]